MLDRRWLVARCVALVLVAGAATAAPAAPTAAQRCVARELDTAARAIVGHLACEARGLKQGVPARPTCRDAADERAEAAFGRTEVRGGCPFPGNVGAVGGFVDRLVGQVLAGASDGACGAAKLRAAAHKAAADLACERGAVRRGSIVDPACRAQALAVFQRRFAEAERRHTCTETGDAAAVDATLAPLVGEIAAHLVSGPSLTEPRPKDLTATVAGALVALGWTPPGAASVNTHVRVVRRLDVPPSDADDPAAVAVFFGTAATASESLGNLLPTTPATARVYHYAAFGCTAAGSCESAGSRATLSPTLAQVLRAGGYVLHWRHAAADVCADQLQLGTAATTMSPDWWKSCDADCGAATARQLNATGVAQASTVGQVFDTLGFPVGRVISSEFCRNVTTAELMDFGPTIELDPGITYFVYDEPGRCAASYALLRTAPAAGTNTAIVGHAGFTCAVLDQLAWGEAAIFKPDGLGGATFVARVTATAWGSLE
ncbi:MAG: hypothetical protein IT294_16835 [Deltaproteobacteria bacterium]|nr:hypothetical protein [Deltaproteobacteria bacterium]